MKGIFQEDKKRVAELSPDPCCLGRYATMIVRPWGAGSQRRGVRGWGTSFDPDGLINIFSGLMLSHER